MTDRELMQEALDALTYVGDKDIYSDTIDALRARLAQPDSATHSADSAESFCKPEPVVTGETSDGYHTFNELYEFRKAYNAALFNEWAAHKKCFVHKSWKHHDGELCFGGGWFIVVARLIGGQISNHYKAEDWDLFQIPETDKALFEFDGHTGADVIEQLKNYTAPPQREWQELTDEEYEALAEKHVTNCYFDTLTYARAVETKLKEKNHG